MISLLGGKIKDLFSHSKHRSNYPAVKIGRLGVFLKYQHSRIGSDILNFVKDMFTVNNRTGCSFITVDALCPAGSSYIKNYFLYLDKQSAMDETKETILLYYDLSRLID